MYDGHSMIVLSVIIATATTTVSNSTTMSMQTQSSSSGNSINLPIAIGVPIAVIALLLFVVMVVGLLFIIIRQRSKKRTKCKEKECEGRTELQSFKTFNGDNKGRNKNQEPVYSMIENNSQFEVQTPNQCPDSLGNEEILERGHKEQVPSSPINVANSSSPVDIIHITKTTITDGEHQYSCPRVPSVEALYSELMPSSVPSDVSDSNSSITEYFNLRNRLYSRDENGYDHVQPLSFVSSETYSLEPTYDIPKKAGREIPVIRIGSENLQEIKHLGIGQSGDVVLAQTVGLSLKDLSLSTTEDDKEISLGVAVKKMKVSSRDKASFEKECKFLSQLKHKNIIQLLAVSRDDSQPFMVLQYMKHGDLHQYLLKHQLSEQHPPRLHGELSPQNLLSMAIQVACGMAYLASYNYVHRDLATRNCLVGENNIIKIADFGLSCSLYDSVYYRVKGKAKMPIRWMVTECFYGKFSQFSDVWAYGVTVWEIYTMGREPPYSSFGDLEIIEDALKVENRTLLSKPRACPNEVYEVLCMSCWVPEYGKRNKFSEIHKKLLKIEKMLFH